MQVTQQPTEQRQLEQPGVEGKADRRHLQRAPEADADHDRDARHQPPPADQQVRNADHHTGQEGQLLPDRIELLDHLRHDEHHQRGDDAERHDRQD
ncbi:hypothetical protein LTR94_036180, partial [Friedmanniomyces endolithicus]